MAEGLRIVIGADVSDAQKALKAVVTDAEKAGSEIEKSFTRSSFPITKSLADVSKNVKQVTGDIKTSGSAIIRALSVNSFPINDALLQTKSTVQQLTPQLTGLAERIAFLQSEALNKVALISTEKDINNILRLKTEIDLLLAEIRVLGNSAKSFGGLNLPLTNIQAYNAQVLALKQNLSGVKITVPVLPQLQNVVGSIKVNVDQGSLQSISFASKQLQSLQSSIDVLRTRAQGTTKLLSFEQDITKAEVLRTELKAIETEISRLVTVSKTLSGISVGNIQFPLNNIAAYNAAVTALKANLNSIKITALPAIAIPSLQPLKIDTTQVDTAFAKVSAEATETSAQVVSSFSSIRIPLTSIEQYNAAITALKANLSSVKISQLPALSVPQLSVIKPPTIDTSLIKAQLATIPVTAVRVTEDIQATFSKLTLEQAIRKLDILNSSLARTANPEIIAQIEAGMDALEAHINGLKFNKLNLGLESIPGQVAPANAAISSLGENIETLRAKLAAKKEFLNVEKDITKVELLNKEIEKLEAELLRLSNIGKIGFDSFGNKIPVIKSQIDRLTESIKKGTSQFTVLGKAGQLAGSNLNSLSGALRSTALQVPALTAANNKASISFAGVAKGAGKAFSVLRQAAFILPGIGIAGIIGGLTSFIADLFTAGSAAEDTKQKLKELLIPIKDIKDAAGAGTQEELSKVTALTNAVLNQSLSYNDRNAALNQLKEINKGYFGDLTVETAALGLLKTRVDEYTAALINQAVIKAFSDEIGKLAVELSVQEKAFNEAGKQVEKYKKIASSAKGTIAGTALPAISPEGIKGTIDATDAFNTQGKVVSKLRDQMGSLRTAIQEAVNESLKFKPLDDKKVGGGTSGSIDESLRKIIADAKALAKELSDKTIFEVKFDELPFENLQQTAARAKDFIKRALTGPEKLQLGVELNIDKDLLDRARKLIEADQKLRLAVVLDINPNSAQNKAEAIKAADDLHKAVNDFIKQRPVFLSVKILTADQEAIINKLTEIKGLTKLDFTVNTSSFDTLTSSLNKIDTVVVDITESLKHLAVEGIASVAESLGTVLAGGDIKSGIESFVNVIGGALEAIGKQFIAAGVAGLFAQKAFKVFFSNPALAIAAGAALIAVGAALKQSLNNGVTGFAGGGLVTGPTLGLVGEGIGTSQSNPEVIAPLDRLKAMLSDIGTGGSQVVVMRTQISGNNLALVQDRTSRRNKRLGSTR